MARELAAEKISDNGAKEKKHSPAESSQTLKASLGEAAEIRLQRKAAVKGRKGHHTLKKQTNELLKAVLGEDVLTREEKPAAFAEEKKGERRAKTAIRRQGAGISR
jgi:hypothetical protein